MVGIALFHGISNPILVRLRTTVAELTEALAEVRTLRGILPICSFCKKIRDDEGYWRQVEDYIRERSDAEFSHGLCPECAREHYGDFLSGKT